MKWNRDESHAQFRSAGCFAIARLLLLLSHPPTERTRPADLGGSTDKPSLCNDVIIRCMRTCRYRSCSADGDCAMISEASRRDLLAFCSPSAAITCKETHFNFLYGNLKNEGTRMTNIQRFHRQVVEYISCPDTKLWRLQLVSFFPNFFSFKQFLLSPVHSGS